MSGEEAGFVFEGDVAAGFDEPAEVDGVGVEFGGEGNVVLIEVGGPLEFGVEGSSPESDDEVGGGDGFAAKLPVGNEVVGAEPLVGYGGGGEVDVEGGVFGGEGVDDAVGANEGGAGDGEDAESAGNGGAGHAEGFDGRGGGFKIDVVAVVSPIDVEGSIDEAGVAGEVEGVEVDDSGFDAEVGGEGADGDVAEGEVLAVDGSFDEVVVGVGDGSAEGAVEEGGAFLKLGHVEDVNESGGKEVVDLAEVDGGGDGALVVVGVDVPGEGGFDASAAGSGSGIEGGGVELDDAGASASGGESTVDGGVAKGGLVGGDPSVPVGEPLGGRAGTDPEFAGEGTVEIDGSAGEAKEVGHPKVGDEALPALGGEVGEGMEVEEVVGEVIGSGEGEALVVHAGLDAVEVKGVVGEVGFEIPLSELSVSVGEGSGLAAEGGAVVVGLEGVEVEVDVEAGRLGVAKLAEKGLDFGGPGGDGVEGGGRGEGGSRGGGMVGGVDGWGGGGAAHGAGEGDLDFGEAGGHGVEFDGVGMDTKVSPKGVEMEGRFGFALGNGGDEGSAMEGKLADEEAAAKEVAVGEAKDGAAGGEVEPGVFGGGGLEVFEDEAAGRMETQGVGGEMKGLGVDEA